MIMKKSLLIISLLFLVFPQIIAGERTEQQMREAAVKVLNKNNTRRVAYNGKLKELLSLSKLKIYGYDEGGFAIVTTDDRFDDIIGYSTTSLKDSMPCGFKWWLETANKVMQQGNSHRSYRAKRSMGSISPLLTTKWGQQRPFNDELILKRSEGTYNFVTGCVATAMAQLMNYYKYPTTGQGSNSYSRNYNNSNGITFTVTYSADFGNSVYDWDNMLDNYDDYLWSTTQDTHTQAVAKLMKDCGVAVNTKFSTSASTASLNSAVNALKTYFKYDDATQLYNRSEYGNEEWMNLIINELDKGRPILYRGSEANGNNGHAFVLHGYDSTGKVYINWGWYGDCDGYYDLDILTPNDYQFSHKQSMIFTKPGINIEDAQFHTLTITANGNGSVSLDNQNGISVKNETRTFNLKKGGKAKLVFAPDDGCKIKSVKVNGTDVTSNVIENSYTIESINSNTTVDVEFKDDDSGYSIRQYISATYNGGSISQTNDVVNVGSQLKWKFSNNSSVSVTLKSIQLIDGQTGAGGTITSANNYEVGAHSSVTCTTQLGSGMHLPLICRFKYEYNGATYTIDAVYGEIHSYTLTLKSTGNGSVTYSGNTIREKTSTFNINEGSSATLTIKPDNGYRTKSVIVNGTDVTSQVSNNQYTIKNINSNITVEVEFEAIPIYTLTYVVDGEIYKTLEIEYGTTITPEAEPTKEGYTFSGWSEIPKTMPANDVTITGTFTVNKYKLTYMVDGIEYKSYEVEFSAKITPEAEPTKEGYTFSGWNEIPSTMPAQDVTVTGSFTINKYKLTYMVDGVEYKSYEVEFGAKITPEAEPTKEGHTFSGWSEIPTTMPANDVTITGTFTVNKYKLIYKIDGEVYKTVSYDFGATITPEAEPTKEGYTFSGWSEIPSTMPAKDVTVTGSFTINKYKLTYLVDGEVYKTFEIEFGAKITPEAEPTKEGHTFSGWSNIPATMPAKDVTVTGTFSKGSYKLTYIVDGEVYKTVSYDFGATITPEAAPTKEGYTFSGWSEIPKTMPANDETITGTFTVNKYKLTYMVDGEVHKTYEIEYGATITPEDEPTKEGHTFSGWSEIPKIMPAKDVTVTGTFAINKYKLTYMVDGEDYKSYEIEYGATITPEANPTKEGYTFTGWSEIPSTMPAKDVIVTGSFTINKYKLTYLVDGEVYKTFEIEFGAKITPEAEPTKEGHTFSGWSDIPKTMPAHDVEVIGTFTQIVYQIDDVTYEITDEGSVTITGSRQTGEVTIETTVEINGQTYPVTGIAADAFKDNQDITSLTIPEGITTIGNNAFSGCVGLKVINIGKDVHSIGSKAFANVRTASAVRTRSDESTLVVNCYAESVPQTALDAFENTPIETSALFVEDNLIDAFKSTSPWSRFGMIIGFEEAADIRSITIDTTNARIYDMQGNRLDNVRKGVNIIRMRDGKTKKVMVK